MQPPDHLRAALFVLSKSYAYALDVEVSAWDFAVEYEVLVAQGASLTDLRWLESKGLIAHRVESTRPDDPARRFQPIGPHDWPTRTAVVLTPKGYMLLAADFGLPLLQSNGGASDELEGDDPPELAAGCSVASAADTPVGATAAPASIAMNSPLLIAGEFSPDSSVCDLPFWNASLRELRYGGQLIKRFRVPAASQELVLDAFQQHGWPSEIVDPLPPVGDSVFERRRRAAVCQSLNRNQIVDRLRFTCRGGARIIRWSSDDCC